MLAHRLGVDEYTAQQNLEKLQWNLSAALSMLTESSSGKKPLLYATDFAHPAPRYCESEVQPG